MRNRTRDERAITEATQRRLSSEARVIDRHATRLVELVATDQRTLTQEMVRGLVEWNGDRIGLCNELTEAWVVERLDEGEGFFDDGVLDSVNGACCCFGASNRHYIDIDNHV